MSEQPAVLQTTDLEKRYASLRVLELPSLKFDEGERVLITGTNGSGKSTLLRLLGGISRPDRGRITRGPSLLSGCLGYVPQSGGLYPELNIRENLELRRMLFELPPVDPRTRPYISEVGLADRLEKLPSELSGGFQRLATIAAALHVDPVWLLLDEPFYGLDEQRRKAIHDQLASRSASLALILVTGPGRDDFPNATRVLELEEGKIRR